MKLGLLGEVLGHSLSPVIHEKLFQKLGISSTYELIEIPKDTLQKDLPALLASYDGLNVTIPYKVEVIPFLDELSKEAETIGAVNTIARKNGKLLGFNTDYTGFARTLSRIGCDVKGKKAVVLGHGGASRAIIQCLFDKGAGEIHVISRHPEKVGKDFLSFAEKRKVLIQGYDSLSAGRDNYLLVNATPVGMYPKTGVSPISEPMAASFAKVVDIIYNPAETKLLHDARGDASNGMYMLVMQAMAAEEIWMERDIPEEIVMEIVEEMTE